LLVINLFPTHYPENNQFQFVAPLVVIHVEEIAIAKNVPNAQLVATKGAEHCMSSALKETNSRTCGHSAYETNANATRDSM
jgi:hypothetical protein